MTIRIAYFSWKGHTQKVAEALAGMLEKSGQEIDVVRIEPEKEFNIAVGGIKALLAMNIPIKPCKTDLDGIDELVIATPVWSGKVPPFVNAYLPAITGGEGKPFHVIAEMGGSGAKSAIAIVRKQLEAKGMRFASSAFTVEKNVDSGAFAENIEAFSGGIGN